jgi:hypothetical protein
MGKRRGRLFSALAIGCAVLVASPSWAAMIEPGTGDLTLNQGQGFKPVERRAAANVGDSVMVGPGGSATLVYDDGCKVSVRPGAVATIAPLSPCASGSNAADMGLPPAPAVQPAYAPQSNWWEAALGVALFGTGIGIAIYEATKHKGTTTAVECASKC